MGFALARQVLYHLTTSPLLPDPHLNSPIYSCRTAEMTDFSHLAQLLLVEMGSCEHFAQAGLDPPDLQLLRS
jgi:hypothetical protein